MERNNGTLFRRLAAAVVGAAMLTSLAACSKAPEEPTRPPHLITEPTGTLPQHPTDPPVTETAPTAPPETTAPKVEIDYQNLVTDAYMDAIVDEDGGKFCFHIPQFNLNAALVHQINQRIYDQFYNTLVWDVYDSNNDYSYWDRASLVYSWGYKKDYASVVLANYYDWGGEDYYVYTISTSTGQEATIDELLTAFDMEREEFYDLVYNRLKQYWDSQGDFRDVTGFEDRVNRTLADANIRKVVPYINPNGGLSFVAEIYSLAGADSYLHLINAEGELEADYEDRPKCTQKHTYRSLVSTDDPLEYFIENCDRRYFTSADISGLDESELVYARNAIYAKSGRIFSTEKLANYFAKYSWYTPRISAEEFTEDMLNQYQIANRDLIVNRENALKGENLDDLQYFIENCDRRYFSAAEISGLDAEELLYARNAIYAKSGRIFNMEKLANYFSKYSWYTPRIPAEDFSEDMLNQYQTANRDLIVARENELSGISPEEAYNIACEYWDYQEGDYAYETGFELYLVDDGTIEHNGTTYYFFRLRWLVTDENGDSWLSTVDQLYINSKTGECSYSIY